MSKLLKFVLIGFIIGVLVAIHCIKEKEAVALRRSYDSVCLIKAGDNRGTGALLNTGYVLTAMHVVDQDGDRNISSEERDVELVFGDASTDSHRGRIIYFNYRLDFAFVEMRGFYAHKHKTVSATLEIPELAEKIYTIGCTLGEPPILSEGRISYRNRYFGRASCFVYSGNSGGPMFDANHNFIGVVVGMGCAPKAEPVIIQLDEGRLTVAEVDRLEPVSGICYYIRAEDIYVNLLSKNIDSLFIKKPQLLSESPMYYYVIGALEALIKVEIFLLFIYAIRRHLFS